MKKWTIAGPADRPLLHLGAVGRGAVGVIERLSAVDVDDVVVAVPRVSQRPLLVGVAVIGPLDDLRTVAGRRAGNAERLARGPVHEAVREAGRRRGGLGRGGRNVALE